MFGQVSVCASQSELNLSFSLYLSYVIQLTEHSQVLEKILLPKDTIFVLLLREGLGASPEMFKYIFMKKTKQNSILK